MKILCITNAIFPLKFCLIPFAIGIFISLVLPCMSLQFFCILFILTCFCTLLQLWLVYKRSHGKYPIVLWTHSQPQLQQPLLVLTELEISQPVFFYIFFFFVICSFQVPKIFIIILKELFQMYSLICINSILLIPQSTSASVIWYWPITLLSPSIFSYVGKFHFSCYQCKSTIISALLPKTHICEELKRESCVMHSTI